MKKELIKINANPNSSYFNLLKKRRLKFYPKINPN